MFCLMWSSRSFSYASRSISFLFSPCSCLLLLVTRSSAARSAPKCPDRTSCCPATGGWFRGHYSRTRIRSLVFPSQRLQLSIDLALPPPQLLLLTTVVPRTHYMYAANSLHRHGLFTRPLFQISPSHYSSFFTLLLEATSTVTPISISIRQQRPVHLTTQAAHYSCVFRRQSHCAWSLARPQRPDFQLITHYTLSFRSPNLLTISLFFTRCAAHYSLLLTRELLDRLLPCI